MATKRKREDSIPHRVCYITADASLIFERVFKEESLEDLQNVVRARLGLAEDAGFKLVQSRERDGKSLKVALDDDDDFEAFHAEVQESSSTVYILITLDDAARKPSKRQRKLSNSRPVESPAVEPTPAPTIRKRKVSFIQSEDTDAAETATSSSEAAPAAPPPKKKKKKPEGPSTSVADAINAASVVSEVSQAKKDPAPVPDTPPPKKKPRKDTVVEPEPAPAAAPKSKKKVAVKETPALQPSVAAPKSKKKKDAAVVEPVASTSAQPPIKVKKMTKKEKAAAAATADNDVDPPAPLAPVSETPKGKGKQKKQKPSMTAEEEARFAADVRDILSKAAPGPLPAAAIDVPPPPNATSTASNGPATASTSKGSPSQAEEEPSSAPPPPKTPSSVPLKAVASKAPNSAARGSASVGKSKLRESFVPEQETVESTPSASSKGKAKAKAKDPASNSTAPLTSAAVPAAKPSAVEKATTKTTKPHPPPIFLTEAPPTASGSTSSPPPPPSRSSKVLAFKASALTCALCHGPVHLRANCPVVLAGASSISNKLREIGEDGKQPKLVEELRALFLKAVKSESEKTKDASSAGVVNGTSGSASAGPSTNGVGAGPSPNGLAISTSISSREPSWKPNIPRGSRMSEVTVETRDEGSSNEGSSDEEDEPEEEEDEAYNESAEEVAPRSPTPSFLAAVDLDNVDLDALVRGPKKGRRKSVLLVLEHALKDEGKDEDADSEGVADDEEEEVKAKKKKTRGRRGSSSSVEGPAEHEDEPATRAAPAEEHEDDEDRDVEQVSVAPPVLSSRGSVSVPPPISSPAANKSSLSFRELNALGSSQPLDDSAAVAFSDALEADTAVYELAKPWYDEDEDRPPSTSSSQEAETVGTMLSVEDDDEDSSPRKRTSSPVKAVSPIPEEPEEPTSTAVDNSTPSSPIEHVVSPSKDVDPIEAAEDLPPALASQPSKMKDRMKLRDGTAAEAPVTPMRATRSRTSMVPQSQPTTRVTRAMSVEPSTPAAASQPVSKKRGRPKKTDEEKAQELADKEAAKVEKARLKEEKDREAAAKRDEKKRIADEKKKVAKEKKKGKDKGTVPLPPIDTSSPARSPATTRATRRSSQQQQQEWNPLPVPRTQSSPPQETSMVDELRSSSPGLGDGDETIGAEETTLFIPAASQKQFPYSQWNDTQSQEAQPLAGSDSEDSDGAEQISVVPPRQRADAFRRMTDIANNQNALLTPTQRPSFITANNAFPFPSSQPQASQSKLKGKYAEIDDDEESDDDGSNSEKEQSHIPPSRRAGKK